MGICTFTDKSLFALCRAIQGIYWSGENKEPDTTNPTLLKVGGDGIMAWAGISLSDYPDLHVFHGGNLTDVRYHDRILDALIKPYAATIGNNFIVMDDA